MDSTITFIDDLVVDYMKFENVVEGILKDQTMYRRPEQVDEYLKERDIKIEDKTMFILLRRLAENNIWKWFPYICHKLPDIVSTEQEFESSKMHCAKNERRYGSGSIRARYIKSKPRCLLTGKMEGSCVDA